MKRPHHSGHPPWAQQHKPATPRPAAPTWRGLRLQLTPAAKRFKVGERISGLVTLPRGLDPSRYRLHLDYVQRLVGPDGETRQVLSTVVLASSQLTGGPTYRFIFDRPITGIAYRSTSVLLDYSVELHVFRKGADAVALTSLQEPVHIIHSGITYALESSVLPLAQADSGTALAGAVATVFILAGLLLFSSYWASGFGLFVGLPLIARGLHYGLRQWAFGRATFTVGPVHGLHDLYFDTDGRPGLVDATLTLTVKERYVHADQEGHDRTKRHTVYTKTTHLLDTVVSSSDDAPDQRTVRVPLLPPDTVLPITTTGRRVACFWELTYSHRLPYWPVPLRRRWPIRVSMKRK